MEQRKIIHIDMDAFYASIEQRDNPELRGKPVAVGGKERRGVVAAASYEARKYGVHSAMPGAVAARKCPELIFVWPRFGVYKEASNQIMSIFREYTDLVEPMSLDEAYLDVTRNKMNMPSATLIAEEIRRRIKETTRLTASAGVSFNKILAKICSDFNKPDGITVITPADGDKFMENLKIGKIPYIGKVTEAKMNSLGIFTGRDLKNLSREKLIESFGKTGDYFYKVVRCQYNPPVVTEHIPKSVGAERTFREDISDHDEMLEALKKIIVHLKKRLEKHNYLGKTVTLKYRYSDFETFSRSKTFNFYVSPDYDLFPIIKELFSVPIKPAKPVRLLGIQISNLNINDETPNTQLTLNF